MRTSTLLLLSSLAIPCPEPSPQGGPTVQWATDFKAAMDTARKENRIVMAAMNMDGERANDEMVKKHYRDPKVVELSKHMINLFCSAEKHGKTCGRVPGLTCAQHIMADIRVRLDVLGADPEDWIVAPQHIFISPGGEVLSSVPYQITVGELEWMMLHAIRMVDPGFEWKETGRMRAPRRLKMKKTEKAEASKKPPSRREVEAIIKGIKKESFGYYGAIDKLPIIVRHKGKQARNYTKRVLGAFETSDSQRSTVLRIIGSNSPRSWWNVLTPFLSHESESVREAAALALRDLGEARSIKSLNQRFKKEKSIPVKGSILEAMAASGPADWRPRGLLTKVLASGENESLRARATLASAMLEDRETVTRNLTRALEDRSAKVRSTAAYAIAVRRDRELLPHLLKVLPKEPDSSARQWLEEARKVVEGGTLAAFEKFLAEVLGRDR